MGRESLRASAPAGRSSLAQQLSDPVQGARPPWPCGRRCRPSAQHGRPGRVGRSSAASGASTGSCLQYQGHPGCCSDLCFIWLGTSCPGRSGGVDLVVAVCRPEAGSRKPRMRGGSQRDLAAELQSERPETDPKTGPPRRCRGCGSPRSRLRPGGPAQIAGVGRLERQPARHACHRRARPRPRAPRPSARRPKVTESPSWRRSWIARTASLREPWAPGGPRWSSARADDGFFSLLQDESVSL